MVPASFAGKKGSGPLEGGRRRELGGERPEGGQRAHGWKTMISLANVLESRDITLPIKVHIVKVMVFPVVTYGCETWTVRKAECQRTDAFELWC